MATATKQSVAEKPTSDKSVGIAEVAEHLGTDPRSLRAFLRRTKRAVGRGTSYRWPSLDDPSVEQLHADWTATRGEISGRTTTSR